MAENEGSRVGSCDSQNANKSLKSGEEEEEDRFSALPDFLIHQILSRLPATDLVKTCVLSKWWKDQWTRVPVLKFVPIDGMSLDQFSNFIDKTLSLHDCSNLDKFVVNFKWLWPNCQDLRLDSWIQFAVGKDAKELVVNFKGYYLLPQFLFNNSSLIKLKLSTCDFVHIGNVNWGSLTSLRLYECRVQDEKIWNVLSGSPLLEYLELHNCDVYSNLVIASKILKTLILDEVNEECSIIEISCPNVERLRISGVVWFTSLKLWNLPSSVDASLDFYFEDTYFDLEDDLTLGDCSDLVEQILGQVEHVEKLEIGPWLMEVLSLTSSQVGGVYIGGLTDSIVQRMVSSFPSIKDAFESDLYEMWLRKWTDVPIFDFVSNEKFVIDSKDIPLMYLDPRLSLWILFAIREDVKELILDCDATNMGSGQEYLLPQFLFNNYSFVKMKICACEFIPSGEVNWQSLKSLELEHCELGDQAIEHVLSGSPLLEFLELLYCSFEGAVVVASKHLKTCRIDEFGKQCPLLEISCPNLESLRIWGNVGSTLLKLMDLPSSLHATLDLYVLESDNISSPNDCMNLVEEITKQIHHIEHLYIGVKKLRSQNSSNYLRIR